MRTTFHLMFLASSLALLVGSVRPPTPAKIRNLKSKKLAVGSFDPFSKIQAETFNYQTGVALQICGDTDGGLEITDINQGDVMGYFDGDFTYGNATRVEFRVVAEFPVGHAAEIDVRLDNDTGSPIATVVVTDTAGVWVTLVVDLAVIPPTDLHDVYLTFRVSDSEYDYWAINWFQFLQN